MRYEGSDGFTVDIGDIVTITAGGLTFTGEVVYVDYFEGHGWSIDFVEPVEYHSWRQFYDGGKILDVKSK